MHGHRNQRVLDPSLAGLIPIKVRFADALSLYSLVMITVYTP
jgi:hypothetical protein